MNEDRPQKFRSFEKLPARLLMASAALVMTPAGFLVLRGALGEKSQPHLFVMLVFSGCLILLLGLVGLIGLIASFASKPRRGNTPS